ncbi:MAG TPA: type I phosphomannose isomerase catalytic subunit [Lacipirellulaceae bacterium]|nr:type I phosphomannose isomerase catalytic subunit [Lacipirellulaceae bacterium]
MSELAPLRFKPILKEYLWGGRRLGAELHKSIGDGPHYAESWEVVDHGDDQSIVASGPLAGKSLHELVTTAGHDIFGRHHPRPRFPLLLKYLDCQRVLSVQVHPNDEQAAELDPPDLGKTEAWVVLAADPGAKIYAGLKEGVDRPTLERELALGNSQVCLHEFEPRAGDCLLIEAGTVHALGAGLLIAEIQQASDTTYRLFDWNRVDRDGKPRPLHIREALDTIDYSRGPVIPRSPIATNRPNVERLAECDKFILDRWCPDSAQPIPNDNRFHILTIVEGNVSLSAASQIDHLRRGDTIFVPACARDVEIAPTGRAVLLDMYLP